MNPLEQKLLELQGELKGHFEKAAEQEKKYGTVLEETRGQISALQKQVDDIDKKLVERHTQETKGPDLAQVFKEDESVQRLLKDRRGNAVLTLKGAHVAELMERKTTITSAAVGISTSGVLTIERTPGIVAEARQALRVRDVLAARPTTMQAVDFVKVSTPLSQASPIAEASEKFQNQLTFTTKSERVRTLATWIPATRQILDDFTELMGFIQSSLPYYVNLAEEVELLSGDASGEHLDGLITQATAFNTSLLVPKVWNKMDIVGRVIQQITAAKELMPTFIVMHPNDWWDIRLTKDSFGRYILGDPQTDVAPSLFGLRVVPTTSISAGTFLVGSGSSIASEIRDRMEMQVDISTEHMDFFTKNMVAIRAEKRLALLVYRPASYITGTFTTSP